VCRTRRTWLAVSLWQEVLAAAHLAERIVDVERDLGKSTR
jgi:hypothetical protein